jgi:hypothetical protein
LGEPQVDEELRHLTGLTGASLPRSASAAHDAAATTAIASSPSAPATTAWRGSYSLISGSREASSLSRT